MIQTIQEQALLCADVLEKHVRGIRPRVHGVRAGAGGHHLRQRARQELVGCIEMGCIEICSSKVAPDRTPTSTGRTRGMY